MTEVYFVRHATPNFNNHDDFNRELTEQGLKDRALVASFFDGKKIDTVFSSPYKRAIDTIMPFASSRDLEIKSISDFRERKIGNIWIDNYNEFCKKQWEDFDFKLSEGESLSEVQNRNICALNKILTSYADKSIVIGGHGIAISTVINFYDSTFGYDEFNKIKNLMPWIVKFSFNGLTCLKMESYTQL